MAFDGMVTTAVARNLNELFVKGKIEKIYQPENDEIVMHIHAGREKYRLLLSVNSNHARVHLLEDKDANAPTPPGFCMLLRKHLQGGRIRQIQQVDSERIIEFYVDTVNEMGFSVNKKLIIEIMGKHSNLILVDITSGKIIDSIKRISIDVSRSRQVLSGLPYSAPPDQGKISYFNRNKETFNEAIFNNSGTMEKRLVASIQGISPAIANEICAGVSDENDAGQVYERLFQMVKELEDERVRLYVYVDENQVPIDFHVFPREALRSVYEELVFDHIHQGIDYFYSHRSSSNRLRQKSTDLSKALSSHLDKLYLKKQRLSEDLMRAESAEVDRLFGELLTANLYQIKQGQDSAEVVNYYDNSHVSIPLDTKLTPAQNAQRYYKRYNKSKTAVIEKNIQLQETNQEIDYLESVSVYVENVSSMEEIQELREELIQSKILRRRKNGHKPPKFIEKPHEYKTSDGFRVLVGRNNRENDSLTFKRASNRDLWFHAKDLPGSHVILFTEGREPSEKALFEAAALAALYSKGRLSENVPVDYVPVKYVKKPNGAKPGMVIFTNNRTLYVSPGEPKA